MEDLKILLRRSCGRLNKMTNRVYGAKVETGSNSEKLLHQIHRTSIVTSNSDRRGKTPTELGLEKIDKINIEFDINHKKWNILSYYSDGTTAYRMPVSKKNTVRYLDAIQGIDIEDEVDIFDDEPTEEVVVTSSIATQDVEPVEDLGGLALPSFDDNVQDKEEVISVDEYKHLLYLREPTEAQVEQMKKFEISDANNAEF